MVHIGCIQMADLNDDHSVVEELFKAGLYTEGYRHICLPNAEANEREDGKMELEVYLICCCLSFTQTSTRAIHWSFHNSAVVAPGEGQRGLQPPIKHLAPGHRKFWVLVGESLAKWRTKTGLFSEFSPLAGRQSKISGTTPAKVFLTLLLRSVFHKFNFKLMSGLLAAHLPSK